MKLNSQQVSEIQTGLLQGASRRLLAQRYAVSVGSIDLIAKGKAYKYDRPTERDRFVGHIDKTTGFGPWGDCWEWKAGTSPKGYGHFKLDRRNAIGNSKTVRANRYAWESTYGPIPEGLAIRHICDNPRCCRIGHLVLGTQAENLRDARLKGRRLSREVAS